MHPTSISLANRFMFRIVDLVNYEGTMEKEMKASENPVSFIDICYYIGIVLMHVHVYACVLI